MTRVAVKHAGRFRIGIILALAWMAVAVPTSAQKKDKNKNAPAPVTEDEFKSAMHMPDSQAIDQAIGEAIGYWQIGDAEDLHKYYSEDVVLVSGAWEPPVIGWDNFLKAYQAQRAGQRRAHGPVKYRHQGEWQFGLGHLSIHVRGANGWQSSSVPRAHYPYPGEANRPLGDHAEPLLDRGLLASRTRSNDRFGPARRPALEALKALIDPHPRAGQQEHTG